MVHANLERDFPFGTGFAYHLHKPQTTRFPPVNGEQAKCKNKQNTDTSSFFRRICVSSTYLLILTLNNMNDKLR